MLEKFNTKITYRVNGGEPAEAVLQNTYGHPMAGNVELENFDIWFSAVDGYTIWGGTAYEQKSDDMLDDVLVEVLEVSFPQHLTK